MSRPLDSCNVAKLTPSILLLGRSKRPRQSLNVDCDGGQICSERGSCEDPPPCQTDDDSKMVVSAIPMACVRPPRTPSAVSTMTATVSRFSHLLARARIHHHARWTMTAQETSLATLARVKIRSAESMTTAPVTRSAVLMTHVRTLPLVAQTTIAQVKTSALTVFVVKDLNALSMEIATLATSASTANASLTKRSLHADNLVSSMTFSSTQAHRMGTRGPRNSSRTRA